MNGQPHPADQGVLRGWRAAIVWLVVAADLAWAMLTLALIPEQPNMPIALFPLVIVMIASFGVVGALVVTRRRRNAVGWILWVIATDLAVSSIPQPYVSLSMAEYGGSLPGTAALAWLSNPGFVPAFAIVVLFVPLLFPDGHLLSPRWRWLFGFNLVATLGSLLPSAFTPGPLGSFNGTLGSPLVVNPLGIAGVEMLRGASDLLVIPTLAVGLPLTIASAVIRYRRGSTVERQQLRWFAAAVTFTAACFVLSFPGSPLSEIGWYLAILSFALIPVAIGIAILRYRLYDIDVIINRALVYVPMTAMVAGLYAVSITLVGRLLVAAGQSSDIAVVLTTLVVVVVFTPMKNAVQAAVDRRFKVAQHPVEPVAQPQISATDLTGLLRELGELRTAGILTSAEFDLKKADILARL